MVIVKITEDWADTSHICVGTLAKHKNGTIGIMTSTCKMCVLQPTQGSSLKIGEVVQYQQNDCTPFIGTITLKQ